MVMLSIIGRRGPSSLDISDVGLVLVSGHETISTSETTDMGNGELLVTVDAVPAGEFVLFLKGIDRISNTEFQRQSTTQMSISKVNVQVCLIVFFFHLNIFRSYAHILYRDRSFVCVCVCICVIAKVFFFPD